MTQSTEAYDEVVEQLKYGENAYMLPATLHATDPHDPLAVHRFDLVDGDKRSLINLTDVDRSMEILAHLAAGWQLNFGTVPLMAVGVKHGNACCAAVGKDPVEVVRNTIAGDKRAIFGGVIMTNFPIGNPEAYALMERQENDPLRRFDGVFAPAFSDGAPELLTRKHGKCRMMVSPALGNLSLDSLDTTLRKRQVRGGYLLQPNYNFVLDISKSKAYVRWPSKQRQRDLVTAWAIGYMSNSNTITLVRNGMLVGNGVGQQDRVGAAELALKRANDAGHATQHPTVSWDGDEPSLQYFIEGAVAWSDSYFPHPDGFEVLARAGISAIFASSGSQNDKLTIKASRKFKVPLLMQPDAEVRGFSHH